MQKIKTIFLTLFLIVFFCLFIAPSPTESKNLQDAFKVTTEGNNDPLDKAASTAGYDTKTISVEPVIGLVIQIALSFLGVIFLILMIYGGFLWMTARGNEEEVKKAKNLIQAAIIGLIIVVSAYAISYFVIEALGKGTLT